MDQLRLEVVPLLDCLANPIVHGYLRELTLHSRSGMNVFLNDFSKTKPLTAKAILVYHQDKIIAWGLLAYQVDGWQRIEFDVPLNEPNIQIYVAKEYRRKGIGTAIYLKAQELNPGKKIGISSDTLERDMFFAHARAQAAKLNQVKD